MRHRSRGRKNGAHTGDTQRSLETIKSKLTPCDTLWIYILAHGYPGGPVVDLYTKEGTYWRKYNDAVTQTFNVADLNLRDIRACHVYAIIDSCYSGDWLTNRAGTGLQDQLAPKPGLEAVVVTATDDTHGSYFVRTILELQLPQALFTKFLLDGLDDASKAIGGPAPLDVGFDSMMRTLRNGANQNNTIPTVTGLYLGRALSANPQIWVRPRQPGETCEGMTTSDPGGSGVSLTDGGPTTKPAVRLDYDLSMGSAFYARGEIIALDRITGGRVAEIDQGCDGLHLHAEDNRVGIFIDGLNGPYVDAFPNHCGYGRIVSTPVR